MIGMVTRALDRRRAVAETVARLIEQLAEGAWKHARERSIAAASAEDRAFWRAVQARIEAHDDRVARIRVRRRKNRG